MSTLYTVEEASRWLVGADANPVYLSVLQRLGKDCAMLCRIRNIEWGKVATPSKPWPHENGYPVEIIREVFAACPDTKDRIPK